LRTNSFPILLLLGLATRFSALALLGMTLAIQVFVYPDCLPDPRSLGNGAAVSAGEGTGKTLHRPLDRRALC
jgi:putative oxidoreductase